MFNLRMSTTSEQDYYVVPSTIISTKHHPVSKKKKVGTYLNIIIHLFNKYQVKIKLY